MEDLLLQEARGTHAKLRAQSLSRKHDKFDPHAKPATPIKEEDIEEEFDDGVSGSPSKTTGGTGVIEEARNYESMLSNTKDFSKSRELSMSKDQPQPKTPVKNEAPKLDDQPATAGRDHLNVFKQSLSNSAEKQENTPVKRKSQEDIPVEMEESDEEYQEDEFDDSQGSEALAKVSVSQSGRLPPLSGSYPHGTNDKTMSATFLKSSKETKNLQSPENNVEKNESLGLGGSPTVKNIVHGEQRTETTNLNNRIVKETQKGVRNYNSTLSGLGGSSFGNIEDSAASIDFNLSESKFPGLENTMQSAKDDEIKRTATGPMGSVVSHGSSLK